MNINEATNKLVCGIADHICYEDYYEEDRLYKYSGNPKCPLKRNDMTDFRNPNDLVENEWYPLKERP